ncbi:MAG: sulfatase [Verrucomicrobia bacterium]|nr:MAG: sulfatase [Verrucomicrobiota bacterium]
MQARPNILLILADQLSASMMSCAGNRFLRTPAIDSLAATGTRFDRAYSANPVCVPSRFSLMTGRMPSEIGLRSCDIQHIDSVSREIRDSGLGWQMRSAGYKPAYGGKVHLPGMTPEEIGFDFICRDERDELAEECARYIRKERDQPFFLCASFINPHDICYMAIRDFAASDRERDLIDRGQIEMTNLDRALRRPEGVSEDEFFSEHCPPLPENHQPQEDEPEAISHFLEKSPFKKKARAHYSDKQWRLHRWAYARLTEMVDRQIARVLEALRASGQEDNTLVIFTSDHGDHDSAHKLEHKTVFYEEACRVPLIISQPGVTSKGVCSDLVSNGLDLLPTLCDYAGAEPPADRIGVSLRPLAERKSLPATREFIPMENEIGRMIVTKDHKYMLYDSGENREQLIDLRNDPGETRNAIADETNSEALSRCREFFARYFGPTPSDADDA